MTISTNIHLLFPMQLLKVYYVTLHGLRNGCAISLGMAGADIHTVMDHVGSKTFSLAHHYIKMNQVFGL